MQMMEKHNSVLHLIRPQKSDFLSVQLVQEIFRREELIQYFTLERATSSPGVFDEEKFQWINSQHIKALAPAELARELTPISDPDRPQRFQPGIPGPGNAHSERLLPHSGDSRSGALLFPGPPAIRRKRCAKVFKVIDMTIHFIEGNQ